MKKNIIVPMQMKGLKRLLLSLAMLPMLWVGICGCSKESARIGELEKWTESVDRQLEEMKTMLDQLQYRDFVTEVKELPDGSGHVITFEEHAPITIKNGKDGKSLVDTIDLSKEDSVIIRMTDGSEFRLRRSKESNISIDAPAVIRWTPLKFTFQINFPENFREKDFMGMSATLKPHGAGSDFVTKGESPALLREDRWVLTLKQPEFDAEGRIVPGSSYIRIKAPADKRSGALLRVAVALPDGREYAVCRFVEREILPGDVMLKSGRILDPSEVKENMKNEMLAIVFINKPERMSPALQQAGFHRGVALSLRQQVEDRYLGWSSYAGETNDIPMTRTLDEAYRNSDGFANTNYIKSRPDWETMYPAFQRATVKQESYLPAPEGTSGWYLPSAAEWLDLLENLAEVDMKFYKEPPYPGSQEAEAEFTKSGTVIREAINRKMQFTGAPDITPITEMTSYWTSTPFDINAWYILWNKETVTFFHTPKYIDPSWHVTSEDLSNQVRSVIAF